MLVYVIRHGESDNNFAGVFSGWFDAHLTEKGKMDAAKAGKFLQGVSFDVIYTSDLCRTKETAEAALPNCNSEVLVPLKEINVGRLENIPISSLSKEQTASIFKFGYAEFDGESREEFNVRIRQVMAMLEESNCKNIALFSHGGWLTGMLNLVTNANIQRKNICCNNCTIGVFEFENNVWRLHSWINPL